MTFFTVEQAEELIPYLRAELKRVRELREKLRMRLDTIPCANATTPHGEEELAQAIARDEKALALVRAIEDWFHQLRERGIECKGVDQGLFDFPCLLEDRVVYLCWQEDEDRIVAWHELDTGFAGRKPLLEAARLSRPSTVLH